MEKQNIIDFFNEHAQSWDENQHKEAAKINFILDRANIKKNTKILDAACGTGILFPFYLQRQCAEIKGVDISTNMCRRAEEKFSTPNIEIINVDLEEPGNELSENYFDGCILYNAFPHFTSPQKLFENIYRLLKPQGIFVIAHGMGRRHINNCHRGAAEAVSLELPAAEIAAAGMRPYFMIREIIDTDELYLISASKL